MIHAGPAAAEVPIPDQERRLRGAWLIVARVGWLGVALLVLVVFAATIPTQFMYLHQVCFSGECEHPHLTPDNLADLHAVGLSIDAFATYFITASVFAAMRAGAQGYLLKAANHEELLRAIHGVSNGEAIFGTGIARRVMGFFATPPPPTLAEPARAFPELSDREEEILRLIAQGRSNHEIAAQLTLSVKTVQNHVSNIFGKLQVADRVQAVIRARQAGLSVDTGFKQ